MFHLCAMPLFIRDYSHVSKSLLTSTYDVELEWYRITSPHDNGMYILDSQLVAVME